MGSCFGKCLSWKKRIFNHHRSHIARFKESSSIIEFESLISEDEQSIYPQSISSKLAYRSSKFRRKEEALEFEDDYFTEEISDAGSIEIINPRELLIKSCDKTSSRKAGKFFTDEQDFDEFLERVKTKTLTQREQPLILNAGSLLKNDGSTTHSSLELDWESEGLTYPQEATNTDDDLPTTRTETTSIRSHHDSNSLSNDLEWDEDVFLDHSEIPQRQNPDNETESLIEEIERLTSRALNETGPNR